VLNAGRITKMGYPMHQTVAYEHVLLMPHPKSRWVFRILNEFTNFMGLDFKSTNYLTPSSRVLPFAQLFKQFISFCGTRRFISVFAKAHKWIVS